MIEIGGKLAALGRRHQASDMGAVTVGADAQQRFAGVVGFEADLRPAGMETLLRPAFGQAGRDGQAVAFEADRFVGTVAALDGAQCGEQNHEFEPGKGQHEPGAGQRETTDLLVPYTASRFKKSFLPVKKPLNTL